jgi:hypothetical protein
MLENRAQLFILAGHGREEIMLASLDWHHNYNVIGSQNETISGLQ